MRLAAVLAALLFAPAPPLKQTLSGALGAAGASATVTATKGQDTFSIRANANGNYLMLVPGGTYTVTPTKAGCTFTPSSASVVAGANADFTANCQ